MKNGNLDPLNTTDSEDEATQRRIELLEIENTRLKRQLQDDGGVDNPNFNPRAFQRAMGFYIRILIVPIILLSLLPPAFTLGKVRLANPMIGPLPLFGLPNQGTAGVSIGVIALGGLSLGLVAIGGMGVGLIAIGGGAVGVVALGGGALGVIAFGGGAVGVIAIGGGAAGRYVLAGNGAGTHVFSLKRQDPKAVEFWVRWLPRLRNAVTSPLPVIPIEPGDPDFNINVPKRGP